MSMIGNILRVSRTDLEDYLQNSELLEQRVYNESDEPDDALIDIDKTWDGIIFLLTGHGIASATSPLVRVLFSGQLIDEEQDLGYGPAHYLTPEEVVELSNEISTITPEELKRRFNPQKMDEEEVYPTIWDEGDDAFDYVMNGFEALKEIYAQAAVNDEAIITFLS